MAIKIDRDHNSHGDKFKVSTHDPGFGRGKTERKLTLEQALELVRHYYMVPEHVRADCAWCDDNNPKR
jgi:hypothetical protein